jgi:hypothetical protein
MLLRITIFLLLISATAFAQSSSSEDAFKKALNEELAKRDNGHWLYERSEVYRKTVLRHVAEKLGLGTPSLTDQPPIQLQNQSGIFLQDVSNDPFGQEETSVAISSIDPNLIVIGSNDEPEDVRSMPIFLSTNGGVSWNTSRMPVPPKPYYAYGDPFLAADQYGGFYYAFLIYNDKLSMSNIMVAHSTNGMTWTFGEPVIFGKGSSVTTEDKESIAVDTGTNSPTNGRVYVSWMHYDPDTTKQGLQLAWSDNLGQNWSIPVRVDNNSGFFSQVKVDKDGNIFYSYSEYRSDGGVAAHYLVISYDQGATFVRRKIADFYNYPFSDKFEYPTLKGRSGVRAFPYITMDYDSRLNTLYSIYGTYKKWDDTTSSSVMYYVKSTDQGSSWSKPYAIGFLGDSMALHSDRFMPWIGINHNSNDIHIVYYSSQNDPNNIKAEAYVLVIHSEGPVTYLQLSDSLFNPLSVTDYTLTPFIGDYIGCAIQNSVDVYTWTENRKGFPDGEVYAYINNPSAGVSGVHQVSANALNIISAYPNPSAGNTLTLDFAIPQTGEVSISLLSATGALCEKLFQGNLTPGTYQKEFNVSGIANGVYLLSLTCGNTSVQKKIIVTY